MTFAGDSAKTVFHKGDDDVLESNAAAQRTILSRP